MLRPAWVRAAMLAAIGVAISSPAQAYEFWLRARTIGQAYQLRDYRLFGPDLFLGRRRITQLLALRLYDVGDLAATRRRSRLPDNGIRISWQSYLRIDHDFGDFSTGRVMLTGPLRRDALDVYPELAESVVGFDLMYGYLEVDGLADDRGRVQLGRIVTDDGWGATGFDGIAVRVAPPAPVVVSASAGLRVRASSPLGVAGYELDGTSGAGCREYVEGPTPGTGSWQLVDRNRAIQNQRLSSDYEYCPQREMRQPTASVSVATSHLRDVGAELGYRRTWSETVGLIDTVDRLDYPDRGLYPNENGQAPQSGVNEERVWARAWGKVRLGDAKAPFTLEPFGDVRFSLLHGLVDRADAGVRMRHGDHLVEPVVEYYFPTFDGDSIFNVFSIEPTTDARVGYEYMPDRPWRGRASAWLRRYSHAGDLPSVAGGATAGVEHAFGGAYRARFDARWDDGWGGRRVGGAADTAWRGSERLWARGRLIVLGVHEDEASQERRYVTSSAVASTTIRIGERVGVHAIAEVDYDAIHDLQTRVIGVIDLAFEPDP
jgi:hypothetical protein